MSLHRQLRPQPLKPMAAVLFLPDKILLGMGVVCLCGAALLYDFVTQPPVPQTVQIHPATMSSTATR